MKIKFNKDNKRVIHSLRTRRRSNKFKSIMTTFFRSTYFSWGIKIILSLLLVVIAGFGTNYIINSERFKLKNIEVLSNTNNSSEQVKENASKYLGKNIFTLRPSSINEELKKTSIYIKSVVTEKRLPDTLIIRVEERTPSFVLANLTGAYLLDTQGLVLSIKPGIKELDLSDSEMDTLRGYATITINKSSSSSTSTDNVSEDLETDNLIQNEEEEKVDTAQEIQQRKKQLDEDRLLITTRIKSFWSSTIDPSEDFFKDHKIVYNYDRSSYKTGDEVNEYLFEFTKSVLSYSWDALKPTKMVWESDIKLVINTEQNTDIIFSINRKLEDQLYDLNAVLSDAKFYGISYLKIDLSTDKILVVEN